MGDYITDAYEPGEVLHYFEEIAAIPHGSGNTDAISSYLVDFAEKHGLDHVQDKVGNVVIRKKGSTGCEDLTPVILQGHMDMVCEKEKDCPVDMEKEGLKLYAEDGMLKADGTTLGGDDGIAVAYMLAILAGNDYVHPPLECVFTVDEEIGMLGAEALDMSLLKGRMLLNIDNEEEGFLITGCAGGCIVTLRLPIDRVGASEEPSFDFANPNLDLSNMDEVLGGLFGDMNKTKVEFDAPVDMKLSVSGLQGGHSGNDINKGRANAVVLLGRALKLLVDELTYDYSVLDINGGEKDNAIPRDAYAYIRLDKENLSEIEELISKLEKELQHEYSVTEPDLKLSFETADNTDMMPLTLESGNDLISILRILPDGVQKMSESIPGFVEASLNLGIMKTYDDEAVISLLVRSNVESEKWEIVGRLQTISELMGAEQKIHGDYPGWEPVEHSRLRELMCESYKELFGKEMVAESIHAGVECGIFAKGIPELDIVSFGPEIKDIHTPNERMDIASAARTWKLILTVLEKLTKK